MKRIDLMKDLIERKGTDAELPSIYAELFTVGELLDLCKAQETARKLLPEDPRATLDGWNEITEKHAPKPRTLVAFIDCTHPREHPTMNGIHCDDCGTTREPMNGFEKTLVSKLAPRGSGFVNYK